MQRNAAYFVLRSGNSFLALAWGFLVTFVFIRVLGVGEYSRYVLITAMAIYLSAADLGISNILYAHVHTAFLKREQSRHAPFVLAAIGLYVLLALLATIVFWLFAIAANSSGSTGTVAKCLYFLFGALNLPWLLIRSVNWAMESHLFFESVDFLRRISQVVLASTLLIGARFSLVMLGLDIVWFLAFGAVIQTLLSRLSHDGQIHWPRLQSIVSGFFALYGGDVRASTGFSLLEFLIYNFPYTFIPLVYGPGAPLVTFDVFYKFLRGGAVASQALSTGFLQPQTRAFHERRGRDLLGWSMLILVGSLLVSSTVGIAVVLAGHGLFALLLNKAIFPGPQVSWAIALALIANSVQNTAGSLVIYTGHVQAAVRVAAIIASTMALYAVAVSQSHLSVQNFILGYAIIYALGAMIWGGWASRFIVARARPAAA